MSRRKPPIPSLPFNFPLDPPPLRRWETCHREDPTDDDEDDADGAYGPPIKDLRGLAELSLSELKKLEKDCDDENKKKRPFWYLGDLENPEMTYYDQNDYLPRTIYDRKMNGTLQPSEQKDWVDDLNIANESVVPGYSLIRRCDNYLKKECQADPFIRDRKQWVDSVKEKVKNKPTTKKCNLNDVILPSFCDDPFYGPEPKKPADPDPHYPYDEWVKDHPEVTEPRYLYHRGMRVPIPYKLEEQCHWYRKDVGYAARTAPKPPRPRTRIKRNESYEEELKFFKQFVLNKKPPNKKNTFKYSLHELAKEP